MDVHGIPFPSFVAAFSAAGLWWHFARAQKGPITRQDKVMAAIWAALLVISVARVVVLVANPHEPATK